MGEKLNNNWLEPVSITYVKGYTKYIGEAALFAVTFGYRDELFERLAVLTLDTDLPILRLLYGSYPLYIELCKGTISMRNYEKERKKTETVRNI